MAIGAELSIAVLFVNGYELSYFTVLARVVWKNLRLEEDWSGYEYGVDFVHISENDRRKLQQLLENHRLMEKNFEADHPAHAPEINFTSSVEEIP
jgi:phosphoketolase